MFFSPVPMNFGPFGFLHALWWLRWRIQLPMQEALVWSLAQGDICLPWWLRCKESAHSAGDLGGEDPPEKEMATHSSILAWKIPWTEKPGGLQSMGSQRVGCDWVTNTACTFGGVGQVSCFCVYPDEISILGWGVPPDFKWLNKIWSFLPQIYFEHLSRYWLQVWVRTINTQIKKRPRIHCMHVFPNGDPQSGPAEWWFHWVTVRAEEQCDESEAPES